jgi:hypothetical protein
MSLEKRPNLEHISIEALNFPEEWNEYKIIKVASVDKTKQTDLGGFNIASAIKEHPEHLFVKVFAIKENEVNDNADSFSGEELRKSAKTFIGVPIFCNHQNDDIEKARGKCVHAWYDKKAGGIYIISTVDRIAYPKLARGIEEGYIYASSMGCSVSHSCCSICHCKAATADEYCDHVKHRKNKKFSGKVKCQYPATKDDPCPICSTDGNKTGELEHKDAQIYEHNFGINFIEDSFVVNPACHSCLVQDIFNVNEVSKKVASLRDKVNKISQECDSGSCSITGNKMSKVAGKQELEYLNEAMDKIEKVSKSIMAQKRHVSMEYLSSLVDVWASLQDLSDELLEMGYAQLPSPDIGESPITADVAPEQPMQPVDIQPQNIQKPVSPVGSEEVSMDGDIGSVTVPKTSSNKKLENNNRKKKEFLVAVGNLKERLVALSDRLHDSTDNVYNEKELNNKESDIMAMNKGEGQDKVEKVAEHDISVITEKQLDEAEFTGERWDKAPTTITEKQLDNPTADKDPNVTTSESPQARLGSYEVITEKQLDSIGSDYVTRWGDFPEVITEKQWNETSRLVGSLLSKDQTNIITEKQLNDFVSHHTYPTPEVITEKQIAGGTAPVAERWASSESKDIVKSAMATIADTIAYYGKTPVDVLKASSYINQNVKTLDKAAYVTLINALPHKAGERQSEREKYDYFSKIASSGVRTPSAVDSLLVCASAHIQGYKADDVLEAIKVIAGSKKGMKIAENMAKEKMASKNTVDVLDKTAEYENAITELDRPEDGVYQVYADLKEISASKEDQAKFIAALKKLADKEIDDAGIETALLSIDIDEEKGFVVATVKDVKTLTAKEKAAVKVAQTALYDPKSFGKEKLDPPATEEMEYIEPTPEELAEIEKGKKHEELLYDPFELDDDEKDMRMASRDDLVKTAQMFGGQGGPGMGGEAAGGADGGAGAGAGATMPAAPGNMGEAPLETFEETDMAEGMGDDGEDLQPKPPGSTCPVCTSEDVDIIKGQGKCNNCGSEFSYEIDIKVTKWQGVSGDKDDGIDQDEFAGEDETEAAGAELEGEGFALPEGEGEMAAAAKSDSKMEKVASVMKVGKFAMTTKLTPEALKIASEAGVKLGEVSPVTGSTNVMQLDTNKFMCMDSGIAYEVKYAASTKNPKNIYAQWSWKTNTDMECDSCSRSKARFIKALTTVGLDEKGFDTLDMKEKGNVILAMSGKGLIDKIKTASTKTSVVDEYKTKFASVDGSQFPVESCMQKLANRYGENAVALSGPCEGKALADCVCKSLKNAGVYSSNLAVKVAGIWVEKEAASECIEDYIRLGFEYKQSCVICDALKTKYAQLDDVIVDELDVEDDGPEGPDGPGGPDGISIVDIEPFGEDTDATITIELPSEVLEQLEQAIDEAQGEGEVVEEVPEEVTEVEVDIDTPEDASEVVDEVVDKALGENLGTEEVKDMEGEESSDMQYMEGEEEVVDVVEDIGEGVEGIEEDVEDVVEDVEDVEDVVESPEAEIVEEIMDRVEDIVEEVIEEKMGNKEGVPEEDEYMNDNAGVMNPEETDEMVEKEGDEEEMDMEDSEMTMANNQENIEKEANTMKHGYIGRTGHIGLDLSNVLSVVNKKAEAGEKSLQQQNAQDSPDIGKYKDGTPMDNENALTEGKPSVPHTGDQALISEETKIDTEEVKVPAGSSPMGEEELEGGDVRNTGGEQGAGTSKAASTRERISALADNILKSANEKKLAPKEPDSKDPDIQPIQDNKTMGDEDKFDADEVKDKDVKSDGGFIGKEKETFKSKPDSPKDHPSFPAGGDTLPKGEGQESEKENKDIGIASTTAESDNRKVYAEATRIAGRMLQDNRIKPEGLAEKIAELARYQMEQLADFEKGIFSKKGLDGEAGGLESNPVVIGEKSNQRTASGELATQLKSLFSLDQQNQAAHDIDSDYKKVYNRI